MMARNVLIVEDDKLIRWAIFQRLTDDGFEVREAVDHASAEAAIAQTPVDIALVDLVLPDVDGLTLLKRIQEKSPDAAVIIMTAHSSVDTAVQAMKLGAYDYLTKPFDLDELSLIVRRAAEVRALQRESSERLREARERYGLQNLVSASHKMREIDAMVRKIARSEASTILLRGESGTGKDLIARAIHYESNRAAAPFMNITCTALPDTLLESELFGHEKGAFTDAKAQKKGLFELTDGGTIYLDEIGDMSPNLQAKLLRVLEDKCFRRVGGTSDIRVNVRVIAATNRNLERAIQERAFREDLYYRLNIIPMELPPLRDRPEDIPPLAALFLKQFGREFKRSFRGFTPEALDQLQRHSWPGNVRELRNVIERACLLAGADEIGTEDLLIRGAAPPPTDETAPFKLPERGLVLEEVEKNLVLQALQRTDGNQTRAAELLGITRDQLRYRMEKFGLPTRG
ncbi:MAG: sigma-54-dependent Fis family transcriptional regulator [Planctomycetes bacterium]|nr:sigma-54-dependent Fis family transcriptional regulator [Planctomycetota bacterium]